MTSDMPFRLMRLPTERMTATASEQLPGRSGVPGTWLGTPVELRPPLASLGREVENPRSLSL
jgi:hypothetical protein